MQALHARYRRYRFYWRRLNNRLYDNVFLVKLVVTSFCFMLIVSGFLLLISLLPRATWNPTNLVFFLLFCTLAYLALLHFAIKQHRQCCYCFSPYTGHCSYCGARVCSDSECSLSEQEAGRVHTLCIECFMDLEAEIAAR